MKIHKQFFCFMSDEDTASTGVESGEESFSGELDLSTFSIEESSDFKSSVPDEYRDKPYMQDIDSLDKLYKQFDSAQQLIGKKAVPDEKSTPEQWEEFYDRLRPKSSDEYEFTDPEFEDEEMKDLYKGFRESQSEEFLKSAKQLLHKYGFPKDKADAFQKEYNKLVIETNKEKLTELAEYQKLENEKFESLATELFGENKDAKLEAAKKLIDENTSEKGKKYRDAISNEALILFSDVLNNISAKYIKEDNAIQDKESRGYSGLSGSELYAKGLEMMARRDKLDVMSPEYEKLNNEINEFYKTYNTQLQNSG